MPIPASLLGCVGRQRSAETATDAGYDSALVVQPDAKTWRARLENRVQLAVCFDGEHQQTLNARRLNASQHVATGSCGKDL